MYIIQNKQTKEFCRHTLARSSRVAWIKWESTKHYEDRSDEENEERITTEKELYQCVEVEIEVRNIVGE